MHLTRELVPYILYCTCSSRTVVRVCSNIRTFGGPCTPRNPGGRRSGILSYVLSALLDYLITTLELHLDEMAGSVTVLCSARHITLTFHPASCVLFLYTCRLSTPCPLLWKCLFATPNSSSAFWAKNLPSIRIMSRPESNRKTPCAGIVVPHRSYE